jgi:hypothetical protein
MKYDFLNIRQYADGADPYSAGIGAAIGLGEAAYGLIKGAKLKKEAAALQAKRPRYNINPLAKSDVSFTESELGQGMGAEATQAYKEGIDKDLSTSLSASLKAGAGVNNAAELFGQGAQSRQKLAMMKEQLRLNQVNQVISAHQYYNDQQDKDFMYNVDAPWIDAVRANAQARQQTSNMVQSGINTLGGAAINYGAQKSSANDYDNYRRESGGTPRATQYSYGGDGGSVAKQDAPTLMSDYFDWRSMGENDTPAPDFK